MGSNGKPKKGYSVIEATNWYSYVSNNPVKYVDPTGMCSSSVVCNGKFIDRRGYPKRGRSGGSSGGNFYSSNFSSVPNYVYNYDVSLDSDVVYRAMPGAMPAAKPRNTSDSITDGVQKFLGQPYISGINDCDIWVSNVLEDAGVTGDNNPVVNPETTTVSGHKQNMGSGQKDPSEGWNIHIKGGHMSLVEKDSGQYSAAHQGYNSASMNIESEGETNWYSSQYEYDDQKSFKNSYWGSGIHYPIRKEED